MPIKGLSENRRMPRLGKIRLGIKIDPRQTGRPYPQAVDYFVCPKDVQAVYGEKPRILRIMFPTENPEQWASQYYRAYSATRGLTCKGDGESAMALIDIETGALATKDSTTVELRPWECLGKDCPVYTTGACKAVMNLQFLLPEVDGIGVWQIDTSSVNSILNINSAVDLIRNLTGRISMIPLELHLVEMDASPDGKRKTIHVLDLRAPYRLDKLLEAAHLPIGHALLPIPDEEAPDDLYPQEILDKAEVMAPPEAPRTAPAPRTPRKAQNTPQPPKTAPVAQAAQAVDGAGNEALKAKRKAPTTPPDFVDFADRRSATPEDMAAIKATMAEREVAAEAGPPDSGEQPSMLGGDQPEIATDKQWKTLRALYRYPGGKGAASRQELMVLLFATAPGEFTPPHTSLTENQADDFIAAAQG